MKDKKSVIETITLLVLGDVLKIIEDCCARTSSCENCILFKEVNRVPCCGMMMIKNILKDNGFGE